MPMPSDMFFDQMVRLLKGPEGAGLRERFAELELKKSEMEKISDRLARAAMANEVAMCLGNLQNLAGAQEGIRRELSFERAGIRCARLDDNPDEADIAARQERIDALEPQLTRAEELMGQYEERMAFVVKRAGYPDDLAGVENDLISEEEREKLTAQMVEFQQEYHMLARAIKAADEGK